LVFIQCQDPIRIVSANPTHIANTVIWEVLYLFPELHITPNFKKPSGKLLKALGEAVAKNPPKTALQKLSIIINLISIIAYILYITY